MTTRRLALPIILLGCVSLAAGPVVGQLDTVDTTARIELNGPATVKPGETVTIRVDVATARPLYAAQFGLSVDRTTLTPTTVEKGGFLARDAQSVVVADEVSDRNVSYGETRVGVDTGVNGTGTLATVSFSVAEDATNGTVGLGLRNVKLVTPAAEPVTTSTRNLTVAIDESNGGSGGGGGGGGGGGVGQPGGGTQGEVEVTNLSLLDTTVTTDAAVVTRVDLANFDPAAGRITLTLTANGGVVTERTLSVGASSRRAVHLEHRFGDPGTYVLQVNGSPVGSVTVTAADTPTATATPTGTPTATPTPTDTPRATPTDTPRATPTGTSTASGTPSGSTVPSDPPTTTGDGAGLGIGATVVALLLLLVRYARD